MPSKKDWYFSLKIWAASHLVMLFGAALYMVFIKHSLANFPFFSLTYAGIHDDSGWYSFIAGQGYIPEDTAFFPLYPALVALVHIVTHVTIATAGLFVANVFMILDIYVLLQLFKTKLDEQTAKTAVILFTLFPLSSFLSSMYTESLFIFGLCASIWQLSKKNYILASIFGACAVLTRNEGVLVLLPFAVAIWAEYRVQKRIPIKDMFPMLLVPGALLGYCGFLWFRFGDPLLFSHVETLWGREFMNPFETLYLGFARFMWLWNHNEFYGHVYYLVENLSVIFALSLVPVVWRIDRTWAVIAGLMILIPLADPGIGVNSIVTKPHPIVDYFFSFSRYVLPMFGLFAGLAVLLRRVFIKRFTIGFSSLGLAASMFPFMAHWFMA